MSLTRYGASVWIERMRAMKEALRKNAGIVDTPKGPKPEKVKTPLEKSGGAAVLSFFIPGLGQIYTGRFMAAIFWFILTPLGYLFFILPGVLFHCMAIKDAYDRGQ